MDGWVLVTYPTVRDVYVDDAKSGVTNTAFDVQLGTHKFDLDQPQDYKPDSVTALIDGTPITPTVIAFEPK